VADERRLPEDIDERIFARAALEHLDAAWPEIITLDIAAFDIAPDHSQFRRAIQFLVDEGLIQYDLCMLARSRTVYRYAAITQHGREVLRTMREPRTAGQLLPEAGLPGDTHGFARGG
jgi:hypothetical protein